jgi:hypothetical protein
MGDQSDEKMKPYENEDLKTIKGKHSYALKRTEAIKKSPL